jgi:type I restriction enzyme S subunit
MAPYLEMKNVASCASSPLNWNFRKFTSGMRFQNGDTVLARITPCLENGKTCFVHFLDHFQIGWGSTEFIVMRMRDGFHPFVSYLWAKDKDFRKFAIGAMSGTSGRQRAKADDLKAYRTKRLPPAHLEEINSLCSDIVPKLTHNFYQVRHLKNLRDILLPKLVSGEIRVKDEER